MLGMRPTMKTKRISRVVMNGKLKPVIRRAINRNAHVITPHGKIMAGRKGRKG